MSLEHKRYSTANLNALTEQIIGAALEIHKALGPGLLESAYEECLCHELAQRDLHFLRQRPVPIEYRGVRLDCGYRLDLLVEDLVVVEIKAVDQLTPVHLAQLRTYLRLSDFPIGLLMNFNVYTFKHGLKRLANHYMGPSPSEDSTITNGNPN
jgi:GxxExxY protein